MIIPTMTNEEIHVNILHDFHFILSRKFEQLGKVYDKIRRKNNIPKDAIFPKFFEFRTPSKNTWNLLLTKAPADNFYKGQDSINVLSFFYYFIDKRIRVFKVIPHENGKGVNGLAVFNAHFFSRYNERMNLNLINPLDKVKHFFINNGYSMDKLIQKDGKNLMIGKCRDGLNLGELQHLGKWAIYKTFIPNNYAFDEQKDTSEELLNDLQKEIEAELNKPEFDKVTYFQKADVYKGITQ